MSKIIEEIERREWEEGYREGIQLGLEEVKSLWKKEGRKLGFKEGILYSIKQMMKEFAIDIEKAMNVLNIPENERDDYRNN